MALGKALDEEYSTVVYPGHPELPSVPRGSLDDEWLPVVGRDRLLVITRDQRIRYRTVEKQLWKEHRVRGFVLTGRTSQSTETSLRILALHWPEHQPGYSAPRGALDVRRDDGPNSGDLTRLSRERPQGRGGRSDGLQARGRCR